MLIVNGATSGNLRPWFQNVDLVSGTQYSFTAYVRSPFAPESLSLSLDGSAINGSTVAVPTGGWSLWSFSFTAPSTGTHVVAISVPSTAFSGNDFTVDDMALEAVVPISGTVTLEDWSILAAGGMEVVIEIRGVGSSTPLQTVTENLDPSGDYSFGAIVSPGMYDITAKGSHWLRRLRSGVVVTAAGASDVDFTLVNGDCDGDNEVGIGDYSILSTAYGSYDGDPNWSESADLNGDLAVDIADYAILSANYGEVGD